MHVALWAALALGNLPVYLYPQRALPDADWPTHAVITVPQGWIKPTQQFYLTENDHPMLAQVAVAARWPDGSPKWLHAHGVFRYVGGEPAKYAFVRAAQLPADVPQSPLSVSDDDQGIHIDTGAIKLNVARPFNGITTLSHGGQTLVSGAGGPYVIDGEGTLWQAMHDAQAEIIVEQQGPAQVTIKASGWYQTPQPRDDAFCRFTTRITAYAGSPIVKIDHATTFADDMKRHTVAELAFKFSLSEATAFSSSTARGKFHDKQRAAFLAQLTDDRLWLIAQRGDDADRDIQSIGHHERSAGWFSAQLGQRRLALLTKDFWQKCPKEVKISPRELVYYAWPKHGELSKDDPTATLDQNVYKFQCFHRGNLLDGRLPDAYFEALTKQKDTTECKAEYARAANLHGASIHNEFALAIVPDAADSARADEYLDRLERLYLQDPVARVSPQAMADSGVFGPVGAAGQGFEELDRTAVDGMLGYAHAIERYGDYGWAIYGNTHHEELMNPAVSGVADVKGVPAGRPSLHRVWNNNHYQHVSTAWRLWAYSGDPRMLAWARTCTDNYASIGQVRFDKKWDREPPGPERRPSVKYHVPGAFYHCKGLVPWGGRDYRMDHLDIDAGLVGHWPDPSSLLFAWLLDSNRWAKDGYDLWLKEVKPPKTAGAREGNQTVVHLMTAYEYQPSPALLETVHSMAKGFLIAPILTHRPGPIWDPTWLSRYHELFPADQAFNKYLLESADAVGLNCEGFWSLALCATAYDMTGDKKYLLRHAGTLDRTRRQLFQDPTGRWQNYGHRPGATCDSQFAMQWPRFRAALGKAGFRQLDELHPPDEPGHYLSSTSRFDNDADIDARGTRILILNPGPKGVSKPMLGIDGSAVIGGEIHATSLRLLDPARQTVWKDPRIAMSAGKTDIVERPSSWQVVRQSYPLGDADGLYSLLVGSHEIGIFQPVAGGLPECQVLQSEKIQNWSEPVLYRCKLTKGWLVPVARTPLRLKFTAIGDRYGSYVSIAPRKGQKWERWLVAGQTADIMLKPAQGPWQLEVFGDHYSATEIQITASDDQPLLYGSKLPDIELIKDKLRR